VGTHGCKPFRSGEEFRIFAVLRRIGHRRLLIQVRHPFLGEGCPDDVAGEILHGRFILGGDAGAAEDVESGMPPCGEHGDHLLRDLSFGEQHLEQLVPEDGFQFFQFQGRGDPKHALVAIEAAVGDEDVTVRIEAQEIAEGLDGDDSAGNGFLLGHRFPEKYLQRFPGATAQIGKKLPIIEEPNFPSNL